MAKKKSSETVATAEQPSLPIETAAFPQLPPKQAFSGRWENWIALRSPLFHGGDQNYGTTRLFRSMKVVCDDGRVRRIPVYSGNAVRGMIRDIAAEQLLSTLNVQVPPAVFHFLTSGGSLTSGGGSGTIDVGTARRLRNTIPMIGLFGGGVGNQILEGKLKFFQCLPVCRETLHLLQPHYASAPTAHLSIRELRDMDFGTRRDDSKREEAQRYLAGPSAKAEGEVATQMKYEQEVLVPGTCLRFGFSVEGATAIEWRAFLAAFVGFCLKPFLGGRSSAGYGELATVDLYSAATQIEVIQEGPVVDMERPLAVVEPKLNTEERLLLEVAEIQRGYTEDVRARREEIIRALGEVV